MPKKRKKKNTETDEDIRKLVIARLSVLSSDTMKVIGDKGAFSREELIQHVQNGDDIGKVVTNVEMEWLRALKSGIIKELNE